MTVRSERQQGVPLGATIEETPGSTTRPAPLASVIQLSIEDSAVEAARYLAGVEGARVILVVPAGSDWGEADFELIARRAAGLGLALAIVSRIQMFGHMPGQAVFIRSAQSKMRNVA